jgi:uncharacterized glyoxalase superfamily protein PhnB
LKNNTAGVRNKRPGSELTIDSNMCDDIEATVEELRAKGAQFREEIEEREYGRVIMMIVPGADDIQLYQPTHKLAYNL